MADIVSITSALGCEAFKNTVIWCGNRYGRRCHEAARANKNVFGTKCTGHCGQYCHYEYTEAHRDYYRRAFEGNDKTYVRLD